MSITNIEPGSDQTTQCNTESGTQHQIQQNYRETNGVSITSNLQLYDTLAED